MRAKFYMIAAALSISIAVANAGPIPVVPFVGSAGESLLTSFVVGPASSLNVDWMVVPVGPGAIGYFYQIENTTGVGIDAFSITLNPASLGSILGGGVLAGDDLDLPTVAHPPHVVGFFPILAGEADPFPMVPLVAALTTLDPIDATITWTFAPIAPGTQSDTMFFVSSLPPTYGNAVAQDSTPPAPWGSLAVGAQPVPIPVPEPSSIAAMITGAVGLLAFRRRK